MMPVDTLQWESFISRSFTVYQRVRLTLESYSSVFFKIAVLLFGLFIFRMMSLKGNLPLIETVVSLIFSLVLSYVLLFGLAMLTELYGTRRLAVFSLVLLAISVLILIVGI